MFKKFISYLIIFSILFADGAFCMRKGSGGDSEDKEPSLYKRSLSSDDVPLNNQPSLPRVRSEELLRRQGDSADVRDVQAFQLPILPRLLSLPAEEGGPFPAQGDPEPLSSSEGAWEKAEFLGSPAVFEADEKDETDKEDEEDEIEATSIAPFSSSEGAWEKAEPFGSPPAVEADKEDKVEEGEDEIEAISAAPLALAEEDEDGFVDLSERLGTQVRLNLLEGGDPLLEDSQIQETPSQKYLRLLRINPQEFSFEESEALEVVLRIEGSWKNHLVWANLEVLIHKSLFALTTNKNAVNKRKQKACCDPLWLHGGPLPLEDDAAIKRNVVLKTLGNSLEEGVIESLHTALLALLGYQVYKLIQSGEWDMDFVSLASFYFVDSDAVSYLGIIRMLHAQPGLFAVLGAPLVYAIAKTLYSYLQISEPTHKVVSEDIESLTNRSRKWDSMIFNLLSLIPTVSTLLNFHPIKRKIPGLTSLILWEGKLPSEARDNAFNALLELASTRTGFSQMTALESLACLAHGMNLRNLTLRPHDVEDLLHIKLRAFHALKEIYKEIPTCSLNKFRTAALLWDIGQSPSYFISLVEPVIKAFRAALYVYMIYGIYDVLYKYFTCPYEYLENFSWLNGGLQPYASDYSQDCFDAQVAAFNTLPGQPASTLVGDLRRYHFKGPYKLDLSTKGIEGSVLAEIVEGFQKATVPLKSLNISYNPITNSSNIARIFAALPRDILHLDLSNVNSLNSLSSYSPGDFLGLEQLTGLQSFNISGNNLLPGYIGVIGQALQNLSLRELRLAGNVGDAYPNTNIKQIAPSLKPSLTLLDLTGFVLRGDLEGQIVLGNALAQIPTIEQLYLGGLQFGNNIQTNKILNEAALVALAHGISAQQGLRILDLSLNEIGLYGEMYSNASVLLSSLPPSLTHLDVSQNKIGRVNSFEVKALAQAVQQMSELTSFNGMGFLEESYTLCTPDFLKALQGKKKLTYLDLSWNSCKDTTQVRDLLQTTPNLEVLNLHGNQLTNGSMLAPNLSNLGNLKSLNLGYNNFTTTDRVSIWNATSFLTKSPFYLDEDPKFASTYLKSFSSTTTRLDLSGLVLNPIAFETIMPQVVSLFPNLTELDLSNNYMWSEYINGTQILNGIRALTAYLPHLTHLQSLRISNALTYYNRLIAPSELKTFSQMIGQLTNLHTLDFSNTYFLIANSLGEGLENIPSLTSINLANCWSTRAMGDTWQGGVQLIQGLQTQPNLIHLDLSNNEIGASYSPSLSFEKDPNSTLALAKALNSWPHLQSLNLADCNIGYEDPASASTFLDKLAGLATTVNKHGKTLEVNLLNGISEIEWTQGAQVLATLTQQKIKDACAAELCTGEPISKSTPSESQASVFQQELGSLPAATSDAISSHQVPWYSLAKWVTTVQSWWQGSPQAIDMTDPQVEALVKLQAKCDRLIRKADGETTDKWYRYSLEDLQEDIGEMVKNPSEISEDTVNLFYKRLEGIDRDFLRKPLLEKPLFFVASNHVEEPLVHFSKGIELLPILMPLLGSGTVPLALGR